MCEMKINNSPYDVKFPLFSIKKLYFKLIFNRKSGNCDPLFSQIDFNHTHFEGFLSGGLARGFVLGVLSKGVMY